MELPSDGNSLYQTKEAVEMEFAAAVILGLMLIVWLVDLDLLAEVRERLEQQED